MIETTETENLPVMVEQRVTRVNPQADAGMAVLAAMSNVEFEARLAALKSGRERIQRIHRELLEEGIDFGVIPGVAKPTLLKPGAEKLIAFYGFAADFSQQITYGRESGEPPITVITRCMLHLGDLDGPIVAVGCGAANSFERRYRYRRGERVCPRCGKEGALLRSKSKATWFCWSKKGGCGGEFAENDERIVGQSVGDVDNDDPFDLLNVLVKMSSKRALVDAALRATATSGIMTQDVEEMALPPATDRQESAPDGTGAPPAPSPSSGKAPTPKRAVRGPERATAPTEAVIEVPYVQEQPGDPFAHEGEAITPTACMAAGCGVILSEDELYGSVKRGKEFDGKLLCTVHGKEALQVYKAAQNAEAPQPQDSP